MEHNVTGLKYFCKTTILDRVCRYKGSGVAWLEHLRQHGFNIKVGVLGFYTDEQRCLNAAKTFSNDNNIVNSDNWANLIPETGRNGGCMSGKSNPFFGRKHKPESIEMARQKKIGKSINKGAYRSPEHRAKISQSLKGRKNPVASATLTGRKLSEEHIKKIVEAAKGRVVSDETREKIRQASLAQWAKVREAKNQPMNKEHKTWL